MRRFVPAGRRKISPLPSGKSDLWNGWEGSDAQTMVSAMGSGKVSRCCSS